VEDHKLITDSKDKAAVAGTKYMECSWREDTMKAIVEEKQRRLAEARAEMQRMKEVSTEWLDVLEWC